MADKAPEKSSGSSLSIAFEIAGFVILMLLVASAIEKNSFFGSNVEYAKEDSEIISESNTFYKSDFVLGEEIINKTKTIVRSSPGGQIIGVQKGASKGTIMEGPMFAFNKEWWRIDYEKTPDGWVEGNNLGKGFFFYSLINFFPNIYGYLKAIMILFGIIILILVLIYASKRRKVIALKKQKREILKPAVYKNQTTSQSDLKIQSDTGLPIPNLPIAEDPGALGLTFEKQENKRWKNIEYLISSHNSNDRRQAIIEADIILDEMLERMGYEGDSIGERLKQVEPSDFITLNYAWEAHKVRNRIAHSGSAFQMSKDEAERIVNLYRKVFEEFYYI